MQHAILLPNNKKHKKQQPRTFSPVKISHMSTPTAYTSLEGDSVPLASSSGGMCVTVPNVCVLMWFLSLSTRESPKSETCIF